MACAFQERVVRLAPQWRVRRCVCRSNHGFFILLGTMVLTRSLRVAAPFGAWFFGLPGLRSRHFWPLLALLPAPNLFSLLEFTLRAPSSPLGSGCIHKIPDNCLVWQGGISGRVGGGGYKGWGLLWLCGCRIAINVRRSSFALSCFFFGHSPTKTVTKTLQQCDK